MDGILDENQSPLFAINYLSPTQKMLGKALERLRPESVLIPPAMMLLGLAIATGLESSIRGIAAGILNINDGQSILAVAKVGCLRSKSRSANERARCASIKWHASRGDRTYLNTEFQQLLAQ